jgi:hypothetical protein
MPRKRVVATSSELVCFPEPFGPGSGLEPETPLFGKLRTLQYKRKTIVFIQAENNNGFYGIIPGYQVSDITISRSGGQKVSISRIPRRRHQEIGKLLRHRLRGPLNFW